MFKPLTKDEKIYIKNNIMKSIKTPNVNEQYEKSCIKCREFIYNHLSKDQLNIISTLEKLWNVKYVDIKTNFNVVPYPLADNRIVLELSSNTTNEYIRLHLYFSEDDLKKYNKLREENNKLHELQFFNYNNLEYEKYFILFTTWDVKPKERLKKIDELIELIIKQETIKFN